MKKLSLLLVFIFSGVAIATIYHFSMEINVTVQGSNLSVSPGSFTASITNGTTYVKEVTIRNIGSSVNIYFDYVVEGPDPDSIDISFHDIHGNTISSSNKLTISSGSQANPAQVKVDVHVSVRDDAVSGDYTIYIYAKETG